jgi:integrase
MIAQKTIDGARPRAVGALTDNLDAHVIPYFGALRDVRSIRRADLEAFKADIVKKGYAPTTVNNILTAIRQTLKHAANIDEILESVPYVGNLEVVDEHKGIVATPEQVDRYVSSFGEDEHEEREFNVFLFNTGLRKFEALAIEWSWCDFKKRQISIPAHVRKGGRPQRTPTQMNAVVYKLLRARLPRKKQPSKGRVWFQLDSYDDARRAAAIRAGVPGLRHHDARHTRASLLAAKGATEIDLRDQMNWETMAMVSRYAHPDLTRVKKMAEMVQLGAGSGTGGTGKRRDGRKSSRGEFRQGLERSRPRRSGTT